MHSSVQILVSILNAQWCQKDYTLVSDPRWGKKQCKYVGNSHQNKHNKTINKGNWDYAVDEPYSKHSTLFQLYHTRENFLRVHLDRIAFGMKVVYDLHFKCKIIKHQCNVKFKYPFISNPHISKLTII